MTGNKMVEEMQNETAITPNFSIYNNVDGTKHEATVLASTKGALVVSLCIQDVVFKGVLLDITPSNKPPVITLPPALEINKEKELEQQTAYLKESDDDDIPTCPVYSRSTYQPEGGGDAAPSNTIFTRSIHRIHDYKRLRTRSSRPKLVICSMCRTHCFDTDNSGKDSPVIRKQETPALKISYKAPDGHNVMDIVPKKLKKSLHKRRHKSKHKKHSKRLRDDGSKENSLYEERITHPKVLCHRLPSTPSAATPGEFFNPEDPVNLLPNVSELIVETPKEKRKLKTQRTPKSQNKSSEANQVLTATDPTSVVSERRTRTVTTYENVNGKHISVGDVIWGKIVGFPWWPGRVCAITVTETLEGIILEHIADIDWYCSPTKSHLPCSQLYPFLDDFEKRFDKKKKTKSYKDAITEAKYDAVMNEQYLESLMEGEHGLTPSQEPELEKTTPTEREKIEDNFNESTATPRSRYSSPNLEHLNAGECSNNYDLVNDNNARLESQTSSSPSRTVQSPSVLIDAFLRNSDNMSDFHDIQTSGFSLESHEESSNLEDCLTISLPSPQSLLNTP